jgi:hypothetical protein
VALRSVHLRRRRCVGDEGNGEKKTQKHAKGEERYARAARIECTHPGATHRFGKKSKVKHVMLRTTAYQVRIWFLLRSPTYALPLVQAG